MLYVSTNNDASFCYHNGARKVEVDKQNRNAEKTSDNTDNRRVKNICIFHPYLNLNLRSSYFDFVRLKSKTINVPDPVPVPVALFTPLFVLHSVWRRYFNLLLSYLLPVCAQNGTIRFLHRFHHCTFCILIARIKNFCE